MVDLNNIDLVDWFRCKQLNGYDYTILQVSRETCKAIEVQAYNTDTEEFVKFWLPKSCLETYGQDKDAVIEELKKPDRYNQFRDEWLQREDLPF